ncbi:MAG TPA: glycosyl hydrolase family 28-related protein, partial [Opitutaceae bacterium]|nr:glycosyl hydrolase family 28-related protein [Opitutaceae bacterium]
MPSLRPLLLLALLTAGLRAAAADYNVRDYGARGDGKAIDSPAINLAIAAAASAGGGTVRLPAGTYLCFSLRLQSHIVLHLDPGCAVVAAIPGPDTGRYDPPEPSEWGDKQYQDFGHSHFHNSLIWGDGIEDVAITGPGLIDGRGLGRGLNPRVLAQGPNGTVTPAERARGVAQAPQDGSGNKAIALKNCRDVSLRDFSLLMGGWFSLLAAGVDNLELDRIKVDTNRDGLDIDACRHVRITDCDVNTLNDDGIVLKSSYALGALRACEDITITGCEVSGFDPG